MLRFILVLFGSIFLAACGEGATTKPKAGEHYILLEEPLELSKPITKVFSLTCPHCYSMEAHIQDIESATGHSVDKLHIAFNQSAELASIIYYSALLQNGQALDKTTTNKLFELLHSQQTTSEQKQQQLNQLFANQGWNNPYQLTEQQQKDVLDQVRSAHQQSVKSKINSVPTFIVNGKYRIDMSAHKDMADAIATMNFLLNTKP